MNTPTEARQWAQEQAALFKFKKRDYADAEDRRAALVGLILMAMSKGHGEAIKAMANGEPVNKVN